MNRTLVFKGDDSQDSAPELGDFGPEPKPVVFLGFKPKGSVNDSNTPFLLQVGPLPKHLSFEVLREPVRGHEASIVHAGSVSATGPDGTVEGLRAFRPRIRIRTRPRSPKPENQLREHHRRFSGEEHPRLAGAPDASEHRSQIEHRDALRGAPASDLIVPPLDAA